MTDVADLHPVNNTTMTEAANASAIVEKNMKTNTSRFFKSILAAANQVVK